MCTTEVLMTAKEARARMETVESHLSSIRASINLASSSNLGKVFYNFKHSSSSIILKVVEQLILLGYKIEYEDKDKSQVTISY